MALASLAASQTMVSYMWDFDTHTRLGSIGQYRIYGTVPESALYPSPTFQPATSVENPTTQASSTVSTVSSVAPFPDDGSQPRFQIQGKKSLKVEVRFHDTCVSGYTFIACLQRDNRDTGNLRLRLQFLRANGKWSTKARISINKTKQASDCMEYTATPDESQDGNHFRFKVNGGKRTKFTLYHDVTKVRVENCITTQ